MALPLMESICNARKLPDDEQVLIGRAEMLSTEDRLLIEAVLVRGLTIVAVSRMMNISARKAGNRLKRLTARLASREFLDAARALPYLSHNDAALARLRFCAGLSERQLAKKFEQSVHTIRRRLDSVKAQIAIISRLGQELKKYGNLSMLSKASYRFAATNR
jgi:DNA-directed RNA polymerase specialized sigma24 family protein